MSAKTDCIEIIVTDCEKHVLPIPETEVRFDDVRRWRLDLAWPDKIALEIQGGIWVGGKHGRGSGIEKDHEKLNAAQAAGWIVFQLTPKQVKAGEWLPLVQAAMNLRCQQNLCWDDEDRIGIPPAVLRTTRIPPPINEHLPF